jgi:hypothetical protein
MKITSTLTDKELTLIAEPEDFYNFPEDAYRAIADAAATKERERVISAVERYKKKSKWIKWEGGECPVSGDTQVWVKIVSPTNKQLGAADTFQWYRGTSMFQYYVIAYKIVKGK